MAFLTAGDAFSHAAATIGKMESEISNERLRSKFLNLEGVRYVLHGAGKADSV
jgi:hypothetical protein